VPLRDSFEQVAQAAELSAKLPRTIVKALRIVLVIMVLSSSLFFAFVRLSSRNFLLAPNDGDDFTPNPCSRQCETSKQESPFYLSALSQYDPD
jgi:hypothetical protein